MQHKTTLGEHFINVAGTAAGCLAFAADMVSAYFSKASKPESEKSVPFVCKLMGPYV